jgi:sec-independent protein translocase protein TatA
MGLSVWHLIILLVIALLIFGPQRIEGIGSSLGKAIRGFKKGLEDGVEHDTQQITHTKATSLPGPDGERVVEKVVEKKEENS